MIKVDQHCGLLLSLVVGGSMRQRSHEQQKHRILWSSTDWKQMWQLPHKAPARPLFPTHSTFKMGGTPSSEDREAK